MSFPVVGLVTLLLFAALFVVLAAGAFLSLDRRYRHSRDTAALPSLPPAGAAIGGGPHDGLVRIVAGARCFRARVRNLDGDGAPVILLHGWPQSSIAWEPLAHAAAEAGFKVAAFDQRGYSPGARPSGRRHYTIDKLVADVFEVADALGFDRFHLAGHDWGAAVGWGAVMTRPERILSFSALSIPHSYSFVAALRNDSSQRRKSAYILLLRCPWLAEALLSWGRFLALRRIMYRYMPQEHATEYLRMLAEPGALTGVLNWYRAMGKGPGLSATAEIELPVLFVWGNRDPAVSRFAVEDQARYMRGDYRYLELEAGHWLMEHRTGQVVDAILAHIGASPRS